MVVVDVVDPTIRLEYCCDRLVVPETVVFPIPVILRDAELALRVIPLLRVLELPLLLSTLVP